MIFLFILQPFLKDVNASHNKLISRLLEGTDLVPNEKSCLIFTIEFGEINISK